MITTPTPISISWVLVRYTNALGHGIAKLLYKICLVSFLKSLLSQIKIKNQKQILSTTFKTGNAVTNAHASCHQID